MSLKKLSNITPAELKAKGVVSLADKPNAAASYGVGGLSPTALKLWFDQLSKLLADKINGIHDTLGGENAAEYIKLDLTGLDESNTAEEYSLKDLCESFKNGQFAAYLMLYAAASAQDKSSLQTIINNFAADISTTKEKGSKRRRKRAERGKQYDKYSSNHLSGERERHNAADGRMGHRDSRCAGGKLSVDAC